MRTARSSSPMERPPMSADRAQWMLGYLPAIYAEADRANGGTLTQLLDALGALFFDGADDNDALPGLESQIHAIPTLFGAQANAPHVPDRFLAWLSGWLAFTAHERLAPAALRRVLANIVPLYSIRGTRAGMTRLLQL